MDDENTDVPSGGAPPEISIPGFEIMCRVGKGAFGEVFLALDKAIGRYRAIKVVQRSRFQGDRPYEIEFAGVKLFEDVSREHEGFVDILEVRQNDQGGYFYCVMEAADDREAQKIDPSRYVPRTLSKELERRGRLSALECVRVALALVAALAELHRRNLVHRDVKPSNIVFVRGAPKLADVGLVTEAGNKPPHTNLGTLDYMDPAVHGTPAGDLYSFGKVLYKMATGLHPPCWPAPPEEWSKLSDNFDKIPDFPVFRGLNAIWRKACDKNRGKRYNDAAEISKELVALQAPVPTLWVLQLLHDYGAMLVILLLSLGVGLHFHAQLQTQAEELRQRKVGSFVANGNHAFDSGDLLSALSWYADAWRLDAERKKDDFIHRVRLGSVLRHAPALVQMWFHPQQIKEAFFAGQENQLIISDSSGKWQVYDVGRGSRLYEPFGMGLAGEKVSFSSGTTTAVTSAGTNRIWLWNYHTGTNLLKIEHPAKLMNAALSPDGKWIAAAETSSTNPYQTILLWKIPEDKPVLLDQRQEKTRCLIFSPDSRLLLSAGEDAQARIWNVETKELVSTFTNHVAAKVEWIYNAAFSPDGRRVVTASTDRTARIWDWKTMTELARFVHDDVVFAAEFNADGTRLVTAGWDFTARIWNLETQTCLIVLRHNAKLIRATFSPTGKNLLTSCYDDVVRVWQLPNPSSVAATNVLLALGGTRTILQTNGVWWLSDAGGSMSCSLDTTNQPGAAFWFAPDDRYFVVTSPTNSADEPAWRAQCFDAQTGALRGRSISIPQSCSNLIVSVGGQRVFAFNSNRGAVWNTISGERIGSLSNGCNRAVFSPDSTLLALARANQVDVFDLKNGFDRLAPLRHSTNSSVTAIEWDAASRRLITSCADGYINPFEAQVWVARTGAKSGPPLAHRDGVLFATFSHDGTRAITCGEDYLAIIWDPAKGSRLAPPLVHRDQVFYAAFSEDDRLVVTASDDHNIIVWSADTGDQLTWPLPFPVGSRDNHLSIRFTADKKALIIRDHLGQSYFWKLPYYDWSLDELWKTAGLLAAQQTDSTESLKPQTKEDLRQLWRTRAEYLHPVE